MYRLTIFKRFKVYKLKILMLSQEIYTDVTELKTDVADLKTEVTDLKTEVNDLKSELVNEKEERLKLEVNYYTDQEICNPKLK